VADAAEAVLDAPTAAAAVNGRTQVTATADTITPFERLRPKL
jgi:hypothetical protein